MSLYVICLLILTIAPTCFLGIYIYKKDIYEKESTKLLTKLFLSGIIATMLTVIISAILGTIFPFFASETIKVLYYSLPELFIYVFIGIALVEEFSKWILVKATAWENKEFNYLYDAIVYCVFVALGFATLENILYALQISTVKNVLLRAVLAVPGHAFDGVFMGYNLGKAKLYKKYGDKKNSNKYLFFSLFVPTILHGTYDFLIFAEASNSIFLWIFILFIIGLYIASFVYITKISKDPTNFYNKQTSIEEINNAIPKQIVNKQDSMQTNIVYSCPFCHHNIESNSIFCPQCGGKLK